MCSILIQTLVCYVNREGVGDCNVNLIGTISIARELDISSASEYTLHIRATDHGQPPLWSTVPAHISLTMADNDPPR